MTILLGLLFYIKDSKLGEEMPSFSSAVRAWGKNSIKYSLALLAAPNPRDIENGERHCHVFHSICSWLL